MTYHELIELYKTGKLDEATRREVEEAIEKQDAIGEYLFEASEIPDLEESSVLPEEEEHANDQMLALIQKSIRRVFVKMGISVGAVLLCVVLCVVFLLPKGISLLYYDPDEVVGTDPENAQLTTRRIDMDLAVYSDLYLPLRYRDKAITEDLGYGRYSLHIPQGMSVNGRRTTVNGMMERNKLTLYETDSLGLPVDNVFLLPDEMELSGFRLENGEKLGPAGTRTEAKERLRELPDATYLAYVSLEKVLPYEEFYAWLKPLNQGMTWCAVSNTLEGDDRIAIKNIGFHIRGGGYCHNWDRETYPFLSLLDPEQESYTSSAEDMATHFLSMLRWEKDHPEFSEMMGHNDAPYGLDIVAESVERDGLNIYGFAIAASPEELQALWEDPLVAYIHTQPL